jgi:hypothetical protein
VRFCCYCRVPTPAFEPQATAFSVANALLLAQASQAAYLDQGRARPVLPDFSLPLQIRRSNNAASKERHVLGWIFIALDALFFPAGLAMAIVICILRAGTGLWAETLLVRFRCFLRRVPLFSFWNHSRRFYDYRALARFGEGIVFSCNGVSPNVDLTSEAPRSQRALNYGIPRARRL